jgi:HJR/Mrr/RecB family endonuclease
MTTPDPNQLPEFRVGQTYSNDQIGFSLDVENLGGIRPALDGQGNVRHVVVLTAEQGSGKVFSDNPYRDRIEDNILVYTGQGRMGDQKLTGRNKRLVEQYQSPIPLLAFSNVGKQKYRFLGLLETLRHYQENQVDRSCGIRSVWIFEFKIHSNPPVVPISHARALTEAILSEAASRRTNAIPETEFMVSLQDVPVSQQIRIEELRAEMLQLSPSGFENFLEVVMARSGFTDISVSGKSGDGGIDLNAVADTSNIFYAGTHVQVQAKRWRHSVGNVEINHFRGAVSPRAKGIFITTGVFTPAAVRESVHEHKPTISLIDGLHLALVVDKLSIKVA